VVLGGTGAWFTGLLVLAVGGGAVEYHVVVVGLVIQTAW